MVRTCKLQSNDFNLQADLIRSGCLVAAGGRRHKTSAKTIDLELCNPELANKFQSDCKKQGYRDDEVYSMLHPDVSFSQDGKSMIWSTRYDAGSDIVADCIRGTYQNKDFSYDVSDGSESVRSRRLPDVGCAVDSGAELDIGMDL